jgi:hypothetical protein
MKRVLLLFSANFAGNISWADPKRLTSYACRDERKLYKETIIFARF